MASTTREVGLQQRLDGAGVGGLLAGAAEPPGDFKIDPYLVSMERPAPVRICVGHPH